MYKEDMHKDWKRKEEASFCGNTESRRSAVGHLDEAAVVACWCLLKLDARFRKNEAPCRVTQEHRKK